MLLSRVRGPTCFKDIQTVEGVTYNTFQEACGALGLLKDDNEWHEAIQENVSTAMPSQLRSLFVHIIVNCQVSDILLYYCINNVEFDCKCDFYSNSNII